MIASLIESLIVKISIFTVTQLFNGTCYTAGAIYHYYNPSLSEIDLLKIELASLRDQIETSRLEILDNYENDHELVVVNRRTLA